MYLIWSNEHQMWWRPNSAGYTTEPRCAGRYSRKDAIAICATARDGWMAHGKPTELPIREADVEDMYASIKSLTEAA